MKRPILHVVLIAGIIVLAYLVYNSIHKVTSFNAEEDFRIEVVSEKMKDIRRVQSAYKTKYERYAPTWDTLLTFMHEDSLPVVMKTGNVPDSLTEQKALEMGIVTRDTSYINVKDSLYNPEKVDYKSKQICLIPFSTNNGQEPADSFQLNAGTIDRGNIEVPVFEIIAPKESYLKGLDEELIARDKSIDLKLGSMEEASTDGNWE